MKRAVEVAYEERRSATFEDSLDRFLGPLVASVECDNLDRFSLITTRPKKSFAGIGPAFTVVKLPPPPPPHQKLNCCFVVVLTFPGGFMTSSAADVFSFSLKGFVFSACAC